jgi:hypothetical protein
MSRRRSGQQTRFSPVTLPADMFPTPDEIASRAHALFVLDGRHLTRISEYWRRAEQELLDRGARRVLDGASSQRRRRKSQ